VPGASVSIVARQHGVNANMVFTERKLYTGSPDKIAPQLMPVVVTSDQRAPPPPAPPVDLSSDDAIEIELPGGYGIRIGSNIKAATLRVGLDALERR
jgi:transposase